MTAPDHARLAGRIDKLISDADSLSAEDFAVAALPVLFDASGALNESEKALREIGEFAASHSGRDGSNVLLAAVYRIAEESEAALARIG